MYEIDSIISLPSLTMYLMMCESKYQRMR